MAVGLFTEKTEMSRVVENGAHLRGILVAPEERSEAAIERETVANRVCPVYQKYRNT